MIRNESSVRLSGREARQASKEGVVRYVLGISLALVIVGFIVAFFAS